MAFGNAGDAPAQAKDDFVGKLVGGGAGGVGSGGIGVLLAENLRRRDVFHVIEPALHRQLCRHAPRLPKASMAAFGGGVFHASNFTSAGLPGSVERIKALRDQIEDAGVVEIVPQSVVESLQQVGILGVLGGRLEVRDGEADFFDAQAGAGANPVLR